ncbi:MAG: TVP38/TMEM64 family protein [Candidatus Rokubacteria bacterium]|nr:TVP38/TMEM64 family protein [Candidatus Rokubacteria bacterium]MBI3824902.1 TVP38/TMEM64 family protein [Candidatus Rokubacteria bacterium]
MSPPRRRRTYGDAARWALIAALLAACLIFVVWLVVMDKPIVRYMVRLYGDKAFLKETVLQWGWAAPLIFMAIQALQVIISPIPGEITGPMGGILFGTLWGVIYSTIGLTFGTLFCFWVGRKWGEPLVKPWLSEHHWNRLNFILEAEGAIICFILYLIPGFPKDIISYLFGISPMPFWLFAVVSTVGRLPGTWISSYLGAQVGEQEYIYAIAFMALMLALCLPLWYYREKILRRFHRPGAGRVHQRRREKRLDGPAGGE